jgi:magnesium chelatase subunit D
VTGWDDALLAAALFAVDPAGSGVVLQAPAGPVRDTWLARLNRLLPAAPRRLPLTIRDDRLLGGLDLAATLQAGRPVAQRGLLAESDGGVVLVAMAERLPPATAARIAAVMDRGEVQVERDGIALTLPTRFGVIALDESLPDDDPVPAALLDRLALRLDLTALAPRDALDLQDDEDMAAARAQLPHVQVGDDMLQALCSAAVALGIASLRAPLLALRVARASAALAGREAVEADDVRVAARLVLAARATSLPAPPEAEPPPPPEPEAPAADDPPPPDNDANEQQQPEGALDDVVLEAALAALPPALLAQLQAEHLARERSRGAGKSGALQKAGRRGRPAGVRRGEPRGGERLNLIETLRAAAPWQRLRQAQAGDAAPRIAVRADDFHVSRYRQRRETTTIFVVDASGSSAMNRLAEAKGAVELLLADCYVRRDSVAVLAFRGRTAELLLPPTRSLVRAKRSLAGLPGGGGTPLAAAIDAAAALADSVRRRGDTPLVVLLTDGRGNVALDGSGGRPQAEADANAAAQRLRAGGAAVLLIDTSSKPQLQAARLAELMRATYLPLPFAGAQALSQVVRARATN